MDLHGKLLVERLRMAFVKGTPPELAVRHLKSGEQLQVYGVPRFDFAEIAHAGEEKAAVDVVHAAEGRHAALRVSGVWRIWPEHAGRTKERQGKPLPEFDTEQLEHQSKSVLDDKALRFCLEHLSRSQESVVAFAGIRDFSGDL